MTSRNILIKTALLTAAVIIVVSILIYTQLLVEQLQTKEKTVAQLYARSLEYVASAPINGVDYSFVFDQIIQSIDFPMVMTDADDSLILPLKNSSRNIEIDSSLSPERVKMKIQKLITQFDRENTPIKVLYKESKVLNYIHYGESPLVKNLRRLPYIEFVIAALFIIVGYIGFNFIRRSEQSNIWVGMAKETAHQLGTPLSSIMGWIELLQLHAGETPKILETLEEMKNDINRLNKVAARFSKIGSKPALKEESISLTIDKVIRYFSKRIPQMGKNIALSFNIIDDVSVRINAELFEWVIENLVKNALDAMNGVGSITITAFEKKREVIIDVTDTGKGIDLKYRKRIFRPGFSTKQRGWGLGLSLSKRIIEQYHKGKLFVKDSKIGKGTTFRIRLPK